MPFSNVIHGSVPQMNRYPEVPGQKPLFHSVRDIALILDKTVKAGYGVLRIGTVMCVATEDSKLVPYPMANANENDTNAKAYLVADAKDSATDVYVKIEDSYKFEVGDSLILDGSGAKTTEVQSMDDATPAENDVYTLSFGGATLTTGALSGSADLDELVTELQGADGYGDMPFTVEAGSGAVTITWKSSGVVDGLCTAEKTTGSGDPTITQTTEGTDYDQDATAAEDLGAITAIDRTAVNTTQAKITFTTNITTYGNFTTARSANVYVKSAGSSPFAEAAYILDKDIDTGEGGNAAGAITSVVCNNAILYEASLVGYDSAAKTDLGTIEDGRFVILK